MSTDSARKLLRSTGGGHGRVTCRECGEVIITCKCPLCGANEQVDICDECESKLSEKGV